MMIAIFVFSTACATGNARIQVLEKKMADLEQAAKDDRARNQRIVVHLQLEVMRLSADWMQIGNLRCRGDAEYCRQVAELVKNDQGDWELDGLLKVFGPNTAVARLSRNGQDCHSIELQALNPSLGDEFGILDEQIEAFVRYCSTGEVPDESYIPDWELERVPGDDYVPPPWDD